MKQGIQNSEFRIQNDALARRLHRARRFCSLASGLLTLPCRLRRHARHRHLRPGRESARDDNRQRHARVRARLRAAQQAGHLQRRRIRPERGQGLSQRQRAVERRRGEPLARFDSQPRRGPERQLLRRHRSIFRGACTRRSGSCPTSRRWPSKTVPAGAAAFSGAPAVYYHFLQQAAGRSAARRNESFELDGGALRARQRRHATANRRRRFPARAAAPRPLPPRPSPAPSRPTRPSSDPVVYLKTSADTLLAGKASSVHTHSQNDVTNLTTDLAGKAPLTHAHADGFMIETICLRGARPRALLVTALPGAVAAIPGVTPAAAVIFAGVQE